MSDYVAKLLKESKTIITFDCPVRGCDELDVPVKRKDLKKTRNGYEVTCPCCDSLLLLTKK